MEKTFDSKDIYLSAVMLALGAKYEGVDRTEPRHMIFSFSSSSIDFDSVHTEWVNETLKVNAVEFKNALQRLKSIVHSN